jgi:hypothetical protein
MLQRQEGELESDVARLAPLARAVTEGDAPLSQQNALAMIDYRNALARLSDVREALRITWPATVHPGPGIPAPGQPYG